jgi:hypothetical protein
MFRKFLILFILVLLGSGFYFWYTKQKESLNTTQNTESLREYRNIARGFSLNYPSDLTVREYDEGDTTYTIVFSDSTGQKSFQIFLTPYLGDKITDERFMKDVSNGVFDPIEVVIGGSWNALLFFSNEPKLGKMREVWFIHDGYLYEVTTFAELDVWLAEIMKSWRFFQISPAGGNR